MLDSFQPQDVVNALIRCGCILDGQASGYWVIINTANNLVRIEKQPEGDVYPLVVINHWLEKLGVNPEDFRRNLYSNDSNL